MPLTPVYGIQYPDRNTKLRQLGDELKQLALDIENALEQGAAPAPVDTGWVDGAVQSGFTSPSSARRPSARRIGDLIYLRGFTDIASGTYVKDDTPVVFDSTVRPGQVAIFTCAANNDSLATAYIHPTTGALTVYVVTGAPTRLSIDGVVLSAF